MFYKVCLCLLHLILCSGRELAHPGCRSAAQAERKMFLSLTKVLVLYIEVKKKKCRLHVLPSVF